MKTIQLKIKTLLLLFIIGFAFSSCSKDDDTTINNEMKGWTTVGDAQGSYLNGSDSPKGKDIDYIYGVDDASGGVWYFSAPYSYHGNRSVYYGATLHYSQFQDSDMSRQFDREDIILRNEKQQIFYQYTTFPSEVWTDYAIKIDENNGWRYGTFRGNNSTAATKAQIQEVLSNVTEFKIRGEFERGPDAGGLGQVKIITK